MNSKHILARLLANENITIVHGNSEVATFNTSTRILSLPLWTDTEVYDLLLGHEVGHALFTPVDGWMNALTKEREISHSLFNIVEDVRIERLMQEKYPGLVSSFKRGYKHMLQKNLFALDGETNLTAAKYSFLDRMNMKAKLRDLVVVEFSPEEMMLVNKANKAVTFDDVIEVAKQIHTYIKSVKVNLPQDVLETEVQVNYSSSNTNEEKNIKSVPSFDREEKNEEKKKYYGGQDSNDDRPLETKKVEGTIDGEGYITHEQNDGGSDSTPSTELPDQFRAITQDAFEVNKKHFVDKDDRGNVKYVSQGIDPGQLKDVLIPYEELAKVRKVTPSQKRTAEFLNDIKNSVANMIKEFELRKAAYQFKKATISKTGMLDVDKLHSYKTSEDLFLRSVKLGEFKDHGMVMLVDYSGSMRYTLKSVLKQVLILATFCKKTNIPFDIYGFTKHAGWAPDVYKSMYHENVNLHNLKVFQILASSLDKATYRQAFDALVEQAEIKNASNHRDVYYRDNNPIETLGDTPLNESIMVMHDVLRKFKVKYNSQKVIFVTLTDGSATTMSFNSPVPKNAKIKVANKFYDYKPYEFTGTLIKSLKEQGLCDKALSYSLVEHSSYFTSYFNRYTNQQSVSKNNDLEVARKKFKNDGMLAFDNIEGYDRVILIRQNTDFLSGEEEEMDIDSTSTKSQIAKQFKKHAVSKKNGRVLAVKFAETVS